MKKRPTMKELDRERSLLHEAAMAAPNRGFERALVKMFDGWLEYRQAHRERYDDGIGADGVIGEEWISVGDALRGLLNGETGRISPGRMHSSITETLRQEGHER